MQLKDLVKSVIDFPAIFFYLTLREYIESSKEAMCALYPFLHLNWNLEKTKGKLEAVISS